MPGLDGLTLCRAARARGMNTNAAILLVSSRSGESATVLGLAAGADDDVAKPFSERTVDVVISRLRKKIEGETRGPQMIATSWGVGYRLAVEAEVR